MLEFKLGLTCTCGKRMGVQIKDKVEGIITTFVESIESGSECLFYCLQNHPNGFYLVCVNCGKETFFKLHE